MEGAPPNNPLLQPQKPLYSNVQQVDLSQVHQGPTPDQQAEYAMQREAEQRAELARRQGEVEAGQVFTSQPF